MEQSGQYPPWAPGEGTRSPPQSVPGRRTPLGAVGLGGFYLQGGPNMAPAPLAPPPPPMQPGHDENRPEPGASHHSHR